MKTRGDYENGEYRILLRRQHKIDFKNQKKRDRRSIGQERRVRTYFSKRAISKRSSKSANSSLSRSSTLAMTLSVGLGGGSSVGIG